MKTDQPSYKNASNDGEQKTSEFILSIPRINHPKSGGALKGIDEKFSVNLSNGTSSFSIPLPVTSGRNNFNPSLSLSYNSGAGNSMSGLGWSIDYPAIQRKTGKRLPGYFDDEESDVCMFSGLEDLVPFLYEIENAWLPDEETIERFTIKRYRQRIEDAFSRIERIWPQGESSFWKVTTTLDAPPDQTVNAALGECALIVNNIDAVINP